jgi:hypothetical protein
MNLGDGMSTVIPICRIIRAGSACADPRLTRAPPFGLVHDLSGPVNGRRSAWELDPDLRPSRFPMSRRLGLTDRSDCGHADFRKWNRSLITTSFGPHTKRPHHLRSGGDKLSH